MINNVPITARSHEEMVREYPITGLVEGWFFRQREVSNGYYLVRAATLTVARFQNRRPPPQTQPWQSASPLPGVMVNPGGFPWAPPKIRPRTSGSSPGKFNEL